MRYSRKYVQKLQEYIFYKINCIYFVTEIFALQTIKTLQGDQQYSLAEEFQKVLLICQNIRCLYKEEQTKNAKMKDEVAEAVGRVAAAFEISQTDQDTIERLKAELGIHYLMLLCYK